MGRMCPGTQGPGWAQAAGVVTHQSTVPKGTDWSGPDEFLTVSLWCGLRVGASSWLGFR